MTKNSTAATPVEFMVMRMLQLSAKWTARDAAAYAECSHDLEGLVKELMPRFECSWCRDHAGLEPDEYTFDFADLGGWCVDTNRPICHECKWSAYDAA